MKPAGYFPQFMWRKAAMSKLKVSEHWELIPLEKRKLVRSFFYALLGVIAFFVAQYLEQFGLPEQFKTLSPFVPFVVNFLNKWAGEHSYKE